MPTFEMPHVGRLEAPNRHQARAKFWSRWMRLIAKGESPSIKFYEAEKQLREVSNG